MFIEFSKNIGLEGQGGGFFLKEAKDKEGKAKEGCCHVEEVKKRRILGELSWVSLNVKMSFYENNEGIG